MLELIWSVVGLILIYLFYAMVKVVGQEANNPAPWARWTKVWAESAKESEEQ